MFVFGFLLMFLSVFLQLVLFPVVWGVGGDQSFPVIDVVPYLDGLVFFIGWVLVGLGARPRGSAKLGLLFGVLLYLLIGVLYFVLRFKVLLHPKVFWVALGNPQILMGILIWPQNLVEEVRLLVASGGFVTR
jgi:hypothetical protein